MLSMLSCDDGTKLVGSKWIPALAGMTALSLDQVVPTLAAEPTVLVHIANPFI